MTPSPALICETLAAIGSTVKEHGEAITANTVKIDKLEERQKEDRQELRDFRKEQRDRWFTAILFFIAQIVTIVLAAAAIYLRPPKG